MKKQLEAMKETAIKAFKESSSLATLEELRIKYLGKKGELTAILKQMGTLPPEERPAMGQLANDVRAAIEKAISEASAALKDAALKHRLENEAVDVTLPGKAPKLGHIHPISIVLNEVMDIFVSMGFEIVDGPEVELTEYVFTALNTPETHPARDKQDTFYINDDVVLRTQTSSVQIRVMESRRPPIRIISPGRVYRKDEIDATHSPMFHQIEGLVVDKGITMANLKSTLNEVVQNIYGKDTKTRFRPHHFPYTEPSCEVDVMCFNCKGEGCRICKGEGYIELLGAGMVHSKVLSRCGIDPNVYSGFAFGIGLDRMTLLRYDIEDMRLLFENDMRFLGQF